MFPPRFGDSRPREDCRQLPMSLVDVVKSSIRQSALSSTFRRRGTLCEVPVPAAMPPKQGAPWPKCGVSRVHGTESGSSVLPRNREAREHCWHIRRQHLSGRMFQNTCSRDIVDNHLSTTLRIRCVSPSRPGRLVAAPAVTKMTT